MNKWFTAFILMLILLLSACNLYQDNPVPEGKPGALYTEAAMTVAVQLTAESIGKPLTTKTPNPEETPTVVIPSLTPQGEDNGTPVPCDQVRFIKDVTIPDDMDLKPGEIFTKTWRLQNAGSCPWTIGYLLYFESGDALGGPASQELTSKTIQPGDTVDVSVDLVAPGETGTYQGFWKIRNVKGEGFGVGAFSKAFWVQINVVEGAGIMLDFNSRADEAGWGSGSTPVDYIDLGGEILVFDNQGPSGESYVSQKNEQILENGQVSGLILAAYPPTGEGKYIIGKFPDYEVNPGDLLFGRVGLLKNPNGNCGNGDVNFGINLMVADDPTTLVLLGEWREKCEGQLKTFEIDLDDYKGETVQLFLTVIANTDSGKNFAIWDSLSSHR
ncbi:MAG: NBR1-Ig-like domain-containing protein [Anaerolineales bacterium]|nr:NBR1-Ig-like domain-containing protein [Anaerolineales bacterium]